MSEVHGKCPIPGDAAWVSWSVSDNGAHHVYPSTSGGHGDMWEYACEMTENLCWSEHIATPFHVGTCTHLYIWSVESVVCEGATGLDDDSSVLVHHTVLDPDPEEVCSVVVVMGKVRAPFDDL